MKKTWYYRFSPFVLTAIVLIIAGLKGLFAPPQHESFDSVMILIYAPVALFLLLIDRVIKESTNKQLKYIWLIESLLIIAVLAWNTFHTSSASTTPA